MRPVEYSPSLISRDAVFAFAFTFRSESLSLVA